uniref:Uncharacterized protein n=1 Tax=Pycnococcus provasolii TaxID=41880 RepID=A0A7S2BHY6_9CHLO|mmetsp:Transcript_9155/g.20762  ORF Transcript_9155/g.20762 Transcript_9155/m.20762 type:complete len:137 (+) Transcript_9155:1-411(+)
MVLDDTSHILPSGGSGGGGASGGGGGGDKGASDLEVVCICQVASISPDMPSSSYEVYVKCDTSVVEPDVYADAVGRLVVIRKGTPTSQPRALVVELPRPVKQESTIAMKLNHKLLTIYAACRLPPSDTAAAPSGGP